MRSACRSPSWPGSPLHNDVVDDVTADVGETHVAPAMTERQSRMIETKQVQARCVQVGDGHRGFDCGIAELSSQSLPKKMVAKNLVNFT